MEEVLDTLKKLDINYELVKHEAVYTIEDMNYLNKEIFKGAEICKNLFLRDQAVHPNTNEASVLITCEDLMKFIKAMGNEYEFITI